MSNCSVTNAACGPYMKEWNTRPIVMPTTTIKYDPLLTVMKKITVQTRPPTAAMP